MHSVHIQRIKGNEDLPIPQQMSQGASGFDLYAAVTESIELPAHGWRLVKTGIAMAMPLGLEAQVRPRSGLALKSGVTVLNAPGTIDADYRGEIGVILMNLSDSPFPIQRGDRIAQIVFQQVAPVTFQIADSLEETMRGDGGFGHTGVGKERK